MQYIQDLVQYGSFAGEDSTKIKANDVLQIFVDALIQLKPKQVEENLGEFMEKWIQAGFFKDDEWVSSCSSLI